MLCCSVAAIEAYGGAIAGTPNKQCTYVVSDSIGSAKTLKAVRDGIDVVTEVRAENRWRQVGASW